VSALTSGPRPPLATILPLCAALGYAFAAMMLKRATERGAGPWRIAFITNWIAALIFTPWWLTPHQPFTWTNLLHAIICGVAFFVGQVFTFLALSRGDVSVATPVMGTKVIFVALFVTLFAGESLSPALWIAALLTAFAAALMGGKRTGCAEHFGRSLLYGFTAAAAFSLTDVLQQQWVPAWGFGPFDATLFLTLAVLSLGLIPTFSAPLRDLPAASWCWALGGGLLLSIQATGIAYSIATFHEVTTSNILYNTRGIWSVVLVWVIGHWFGNVERSQGASVMVRRLFAALLLLAAVFLSISR
jgi:drug/metabolite transporter (DMT)-like permease